MATGFEFGISGGRKRKNSRRSNGLCPRTSCLLHHRLAPRQGQELTVEFKRAGLVCSPEVLARKWPQIHPQESREEVASAVVGWLQDNHAWSGDLFVVQGEFGCIFALADYVFEHVRFDGTAIGRLCSSCITVPLVHIPSVVGFSFPLNPATLAPC